MVPVEYTLHRRATFRLLRGLLREAVLRLEEE
jgi:hypothetical protein